MTKPIHKREPNFNRSEFIKLSLLLLASQFLAACSRAFRSNPPPIKATTSPSTIVRIKYPDPWAELETNCSEADPPRIRNINVVDTAVIHHSAGATAKDRKSLLAEAARIETQHKSEKEWAESYKTGGEFGFFYISYHWLIASDGYVLQVQDTHYARVHANNNIVNCRSIAICLIGDFRSVEEKKSAFISDERLNNTLEPSESQIKSAAEIIHNWNMENNVKLEVLSHREARYDKEIKVTCPGENVGDSTNPLSNLTRISNLAKLPIFPPRRH